MHSDLNVRAKLVEPMVAWPKETTGSYYYGLRSTLTGRVLKTSSHSHAHSAIGYRLRLPEVRFLLF